VAALRLPRSSSYRADTTRRGIEFLVFALVGVAALGLVTKTSSQDAVALLAIAGFSALLAWLAFSVRYEITLGAYTAYLLLVDGYLKLRFTGELPVLARDVLLLAIAGGAAARWAVQQTRFQVPPLTGWVAAWVVVVLVQLANPENGTLAHSALALRPHLEFVPLFFFGFVLMRSPTRLRRLLCLVVGLAAINGVVGLVQVNLSLEQLADWGPGYEEKIRGTGVSARGFVDNAGEGRTRPFALGSDQGFGGALGIIAAPMALALFVLLRRRQVVLCALLAAGVATAVLTSQARVAVLSTVAAVVAYVILGSVSRQRVAAAFGVLAGALATWLVVSVLVGGTYAGVFDRYDSIAPDRVLSTSIDYRRDTIVTIPSYVTSFPLGAGLGTTGPGASVTGGNDKTLNGESEFTYLLIETGVPGLLVMLGLTLRLLFLAATRIRRISSTQTRLMLAALTAPLFAKFASWSAGATTAGTPDSPYLWFVAGVLSWWLISHQTGEPVRDQ
jgi:hypothetical protein